MSDAGTFEVDYEEGDANQMGGALAERVLTYLAESIVEDPEAVHVEQEDDRRGITLRLHVAPDDMGRVIGRRGRIAQAIRAVVRAAGAKEDVEVSVDIVD